MVRELLKKLIWLPYKRRVVDKLDEIILNQNRLQKIILDQQNFDINAFASDENLKKNLIGIAKSINPLNAPIESMGEKFSLNDDGLNQEADEGYRRLLIFEKQSLINYLDCIPFFWEYFQSCNIPRNSEYSLLDIGARSGVGSDLLGLLFADTTWGYGVKLKVDVTELDIRWNKIGKSRPFINNWMNEDIYNIADGSYDFCFCSHVIEHVEDPVKFAKKITAISRRFTLFYCPFNENNPNPWHHVINSEILEKIGPVYVKYIKSENRRYNDLDYVLFITNRSL
jgi:2-polyprenyl-3-methyl-5-hydroxy-6-metoxy-1,4-benzoquinol methylase